MSVHILFIYFFFLMRPRPPRSTQAHTLFPYTTLFRSVFAADGGGRIAIDVRGAHLDPDRSEEHTSELQSRELISYAVFCLKKKNTCGADGRGRRSVRDRIRQRARVLDRSLPLDRNCVDQARARLGECFFFFNVAATTEIYTSSHTLSLHDALPICLTINPGLRWEYFNSSIEPMAVEAGRDRKSTRLNSSHVSLSRMPSSA